MKNILYIILLILTTTSISIAQTTFNPNQSLDKRNTWTEKDLMEPSALAVIISNPKAKQAQIFNIGVVEDIKGAKKMGGASVKANLEKFKNALSSLPKNTLVVVYCGCCPFEKCPNIRPAFNLMKSMGFTNGKLLNLPTNLKQNWIDKGFPLAQKKS